MNDIASELAECSVPGPRPPRRRRLWWHPIHADFVSAVAEALTDADLSDAVFKARLGKAASQIARSEGRAWASTSWREEKMLRRLANLVGYTGPLLNRGVRA
jgi:hypothetical protein